MRICPECGKHNPGDAWNCESCGQTLSVKTLVKLGAETFDAGATPNSTKVSISEVVSSDKLREQATDLLKIGDIDRARELLKIAIKANPQNERAWMQYVRTLPTRAERIQALECCIKFNPGSQVAKEALRKTKYHFRSTRRERQKHHPSIMLRWVLMNTVGYIVALPVFYVVLFATATFAVSAIAVAVTFSVMQGFVLIDRVSVRWMLASIVGYTIAIVVVAAGIYSTNTIIVGAIAGTVVGVAQSLALWRHFSQVIWWVLANAVGWATGLELMVHIIFSRQSSGGDAGAIVWAMLSSLVLIPPGPVIGVITGFALDWLPLDSF